MLIKIAIFKEFDKYFLWFDNYLVLTLSQTTNFRPFETEIVCNFKVDENGRKFSKWFQKTVGKGEIACYEQFLLFSLCFQKTCIADM